MLHLPSMLPGEQVIEDYRHLHLSLKAHPVSFLRARFRCARHRPSRSASHAYSGPARHHRRPRAGPPAARHRQRHLHDAGRRDRHRQHHRLAAQVRAVSPDRDGRAVDQRDRRSAKRKGRHPHRRRPFRGSDAICSGVCPSTAPASTRSMPPDEIKRPVVFTPAPSALGRCAGHDAERGQAGAGGSGRAQHTAQVMPKGRNFH